MNKPQREPHLQRVKNMLKSTKAHQVTGIQDSRCKWALVLRTIVALTSGANPRNHSSNKALMLEWCMDNLIDVSVLKEQLKPFLNMMNGFKSGREFITKLGTPPDLSASFSLRWQPDILTEPLKSQLQDLNSGCQEPVHREVSIIQNLTWKALKTWWCPFLMTKNNQCTTMKGSLLKDCEQALWKREKHHQESAIILLMG